MPNILVSACLLGEACRYDAASKPCEPLKELLAEHGLTAVPVCPEVAGGLPTPRPPAERVGKRVLTCEGADVTSAYERGAAAALQAAQDADAACAVLKSRSPSCGLGTIYDGSFTGTLTQGNGVAVDVLQAHGIHIFSEEALPAAFPTIRAASALE